MALALQRGHDLVVLDQRWPETANTSGSGGRITVTMRSSGTVRLHHPTVDDLELDFETLALPDDGEQGVRDLFGHTRLRLARCGAALEQLGPQRVRHRQRAGRGPERPRITDGEQEMATLSSKTTLSNNQPM